MDSEGLDKLVGFRVVYKKSALHLISHADLSCVIRLKIEKIIHMHKSGLEGIVQQKLTGIESDKNV
jgi:hypothetical protein